MRIGIERPLVFYMLARFELLMQRMFVHYTSQSPESAYKLMGFYLVHTQFAELIVLRTKCSYILLVYLYLIRNVSDLFDAV